MAIVKPQKPEDENRNTNLKSFMTSAAAKPTVVKPTMQRMVEPPIREVEYNDEEEVNEEVLDVSPSAEDIEELEEEMETETPTPTTAKVVKNFIKTLPAVTVRTSVIKSSSKGRKPNTEATEFLNNLRPYTGIEGVAFDTFAVETEQEYRTWYQRGVKMELRVMIIEHLGNGGRILAINGQPKEEAVEA